MEIQYQIIFIIAVPFIALFYEGLRRKLNARFQNRIGPPILQPFYDIRKLWAKKSLETKNDPFFKSAPFLYLVSTFALFLFIPFSIIHFHFDFIFLIYLTILGSAFYVLFGLSSDNPFSVVSAMREMILMVVYEITLAVVIFSFMIKAGVISLAGFNSSFMLLSLPISSIALVIIAFVELHITPFDTSEAGPEIMAGTETEYSGKNLALIEITKYFKRLFFVLVVPFFLFGTQNLLLFAALTFVFLFIFTIAQATTSRYRVDQAFKVYLGVMFVVLIEFILISRGIL